MSFKEHKIEFSKRLSQIMIEQGYISSRSKSDVNACPNDLKQILNCDWMTASRYLSGSSFPSPPDILKISRWLNVDLEFLLCGETSRPEHLNQIKFDKEMFMFCLDKISPIIENAANKDAAKEYCADLLVELSKMKINSAKFKEYFSLAIKSAEIFEKTSNNLRRKNDRKESRMAS